MQTARVYDVKKLIGSGTFGHVYSAASAAVVDRIDEPMAPYPSLVVKRTLVCYADELGNMQSELYKSEPRDSTASNGTAHQHSQAADADDELLLLRGKATTARELQYSIELGKQLKIDAVLAYDNAMKEVQDKLLSAAGVVLPTTVQAGAMSDEGGSGAGAAASAASPRDGVMTPPQPPPLPLVPAMLDAFFAFEDESEEDGGASGDSEPSADKIAIDLVQVSESFGRDLWQWIRAEPARFAEPTLQAELVRQMFLALAELHSRGLMHRDLKLANMLLAFSPSGYPLLRLCDLGSVRPVPQSPAQHCTPYVTSRYYRPPELLCGSSFYDASVDIWALATTVAEMYMQIAALTDDAAAKAICGKRGDGDAKSETEAQELEAEYRSRGSSRPKLRCALFHGAASDAHQIVHIFNMLGCPTDEDIDAMRVPAQAVSNLRKMREVIQAGAAAGRARAAARERARQPFFTNPFSIMAPAAQPPPPPAPVTAESVNQPVGAIDMSAFLAAHYVPPAVAAMLAAMLKWNPRHRMTAAQALQHPALNAAPYIPPGPGFDEARKALASMKDAAAAEGGGSRG